MQQLLSSVASAPALVGMLAIATPASALTVTGAAAAMAPSQQMQQPPRSLHQPNAFRCRSRTHSPSMMADAKAGELLRVSHAVNDVEATAAFYEKCLGLQRASSGDAVHLSAQDGAGLCLELTAKKGGAFEEDAGYQGLSARVPSVADAVAAATAAGGSVVSEPTTVEHGPSMIPEEPDETENMVVEATVADPSGYPLLLHECAEAEAAMLRAHGWTSTRGRPRRTGTRASAGRCCAGTPTSTARRR